MLPDKIALLRRRFGWTQEDLAAQLEVSRQSVSKWESGASQPELDKVLAMSRLFGVSTDYLLKEELDDLGPAPAAPEVDADAFARAEAEGFAPEDDAPEPLPEAQVRTFNRRGERVLSNAEANKYLENRRQCAGRIGLGAGLCVACAAPLMLMIGIARYFRRFDALYNGMGVMLLLGMIAAGVYLFIQAGFRLGKYRYIDREPFELSRAMADSAEQQRVAFRPDYTHGIASGVALCVISPAPVCAAGIMTLSQFFVLSSVGVLLAMVGGGVYLCVRSAIIMDSFARILQEGRYSLRRKRRRHAFAALAGRAAERVDEAVNRFGDR